MAGRLNSALLAAFLTVLVSFGKATPVDAASPDELDAKLKALQEQVDALKKELEKSRQAPAAVAPPAPVPTPAGEAAPAAQPSPTPATAQQPPPPPATSTPWITDFKIGGYGSVRFESSDINKVGDTFTFRRFVLSGDATIANRIRSVVELEFEHLTELEVEKSAPSEGGLRGFSNSIESSNGSEISLEQAWVEFMLAEWLRFRAGMLLVPLGRFNLAHDDNRWDLPRRSLVDRGVPVLPSTAAWSEVGMGFAGDIDGGSWGKFGYQVYVMNGVTLDASLDTVARASGELETEVEVKPQRGTANIDVKKDKAGALRVFWSPSLGNEIGSSIYYGRYTPDFLPSETVWSLSADGKYTFGPFEIEGEYVYTRWNGIKRVAQGFANAVAEQALGSGTTPLDVVVEFDLAGLADSKQGYWLDLRYRFFPALLRGTVLGRPFENPQFVLTTRWEQVWLHNLVKEVDFTGSTVSDIMREDRYVNRATLGFTYRPVPLVAFQLAYERTWTNQGKSLSTVTNFIPAGRSQDTQNSFLFGVAFGF
jgi:hypothetical protein